MRQARQVARRNLGRLAEAREDLTRADALAPGDAAVRAELEVRSASGLGWSAVVGGGRQCRKLRGALSPCLSLYTANIREFDTT